MKDRVSLALYLAAVVAVTSVHDLRFLAASLFVVLLMCGKDSPGIAKRAARAILPFNTVVTLSYAGFSLVGGRLDFEYLARINLRVFLLACCTLLFASRVNPLRALSFSRSLLFLVTLAYGQVVGFRRLFDDFRQAFRSRSPARASTRDLYRHAGATGAFFLQKALHDSTEIAHAMRSRGFFRDSG
jgi:cobalt/nickel transport system permease protein